jgi:hypothetical protein
VHAGDCAADATGDCGGVTSGPVQQPDTSNIINIADAAALLTLRSMIGFTQCVLTLFM